MKRVVILLLPFFSCYISFAQFNDSTNYYSSLRSTGMVNKTNDGDSYVLNNALKFSVYKKNISLNSTNHWVYGENREVRTNNDFSTALDFNLFRAGGHIYYWGLGNYERSFSLKINHRLQGGLGIGYYLINADNFVLQVSDGILYEKNDLYSHEASGANEYEILRNSLRIKFNVIIKEIIRLDGSDFLQHSLADRKDYIIQSNTNLSVKLNTWLSFTVSVTYNKLKRTQSENLLINYGLTVERYF